MTPININNATTINDEQLSDLMNYHQWGNEEIKKGDFVRNALANAIRVIIENVPPSADRSCALRKIREARMDANSAITHGGKY